MSFDEKLDRLIERHDEIGTLMAGLQGGNAQEFVRLSKEYAELSPVVEAIKALRGAQSEAADMAEMIVDPDSDPEMRSLAEEELAELRERVPALEHDLKVLLLPKDDADEKNAILEVRAGTGGDEAALFAGELFRMYCRYAELRGWNIEPLSESPGEHGGYKEVIARVIGRGAYARLKFESGGHRVQRVPETESQGRIHTSACTVAVLPEVDEIEDVEIGDSDLRIDTFRASGAGGQHVNKTDSAIRITHLPTNTVVECQDERSQHKNRARAMSLLRAKLVAAERERQSAERAETRRLLVGSGDRSQRIRTYNFPQGRLTDHRINLTLYKLSEIMAGNLDQVIEPLLREDQAEKLAALGN